MTTAVPYSWLKELPKSLLELNDLTPFGYPPSFPWEQFTAVFSKVFQLENLRIEPGAWQLRQSNELLSGLGSHPVAVHCDIAPLQGTLCWVIAEKDRDQLMSLLLNQKTDGEFIDPEYKKAFYQFLLLELFNISSKLDFQKGLSPHVLETTELPQDPSYCLDMTFTIDERSAVVRLITTEMLRTSWKERFAERALTADLPQELAQKITLPLCLEAGSTAMRLNEWQQVSIGDCLLLDRCTLKIGEDKGQIMITLNRQPFFLAQVKEGNVKLLDYPLYHEAPTTMVKEEDEDLSEFDIDMEDHDTFSEELTEGTEVTEAGTPTAGDTPPPPAPKPAAKAQPQKPLTPLEIPVNIVIEVGRLEMSIQKLLDLKPGALLELNVHPEDGVDLTINGKIVGKGELIKIGESLGVRILDKGS